MLPVLVSRFVGRLTTSAVGCFTPAAMFHCSARLCKDFRKGIDCPDSTESDCVPLKNYKCKASDPPVRCSHDEEPPKPRYPCCVNASAADDPCNEKKKKHRPKFVSMWEEPEKDCESDEKRPEYLWHFPPECCPKCETVRFDELYYRPSDKCRTYQRTWWECCPRLVPKRVCCWCDAVPPQIERRCLPICPRTACMDNKQKERLLCLQKKAKDCKRVAMPCCRAGRVPPSCRLTRYKSDCEKNRCPFPSFSECIREDAAILPERPHECRCLADQSICTRNRYEARIAKYNLKLNPCCRR